MKEQDGVTAEAWMLTSEGSFAFDADQILPRDVQGRGRSWQDALFDAVVDGFTHVVLESGRPLFGSLFGYDSAREARALQQAGVTVAMAWHGTDIRRPSVESADNPWSPFRDRSHRAHVAALEARAVRNARLARASGVPQLVSTPDLLAHLPGAQWLPVVVDPSPWASAPPIDLSSPPLRVLHLPSNPWIKGGALLDRPLARLAAHAEIAVVTPGRLPPTEVPRTVADADVVLDQFRLHLYGVAAVEAMHAGRLVISLAGAPLRDAVRAVTAEELPVLSATPDQLEDVLRGLGADDVDTSTLARDFAARWHDGRESARALATALGID
ncbi:hypothetical protein [Demequina aestuarii]|uniref:hypothetical protein n=1 Tax=Demequina aestuarii TaxID=327095 RepID=UPI00128D4450|nr:hypothetical protein [Demequina aestuarii]